MKRLISIEWNKLFYNKGTRIFIILYFVMIALVGITLPYIKQNINGVDINLIELGALDFPFIWHNIAWILGFGKLFLAIIIINNITNEYSFGTFKQNTIDGLTKTEFIGSKILMNLLITLLSSIFLAVLVFSLGSIFGEKLDFINGIEFLAGYFIEIFSYIIMAMFLSFLLRKSAFAILSIIVLTIGETVIKIIESFIKMSKDGFQSETTQYYLSNFLPLNANSKIVDYPSMSLTNALSGQKLFVADTVQWEYFGITIFYMIIFLGLTLFIIKKRDL